jgi:hypothetical protein
MFMFCATAVPANATTANASAAIEIPFLRMVVLPHHMAHVLFGEPVSTSPGLR